MRLATSMLAGLALASSQAIALGTESPVTATRNVHTECVQSDSQERCDAFFRDYMDAARARHEEEEALAAANKARYEDLLRQSQIATLPALILPARITLNSQVTSWRERAARNNSNFRKEWPFWFHIDSRGLPFHSSVSPSRYQIGLSSYNWFEVYNNSVENCRPLSRVTSLLGQKPGCIALEDLRFTPARTADGSAIAARVKGVLVMTATGVNIVALGAEPILRPNPNVPTEAWTARFGGSGAVRNPPPSLDASAGQSAAPPSSPPTGVSPEHQIATGTPPELDAKTFSPSFLCSAASTATEHAICGNEQLALLDRTLARAYSASLARLDGARRSELMAGQKSWLKQRDSDCGGDVVCLQATMEARLERLLSP